MGALLHAWRPLGPTLMAIDWSTLALLEEVCLNMRDRRDKIALTWRSRLTGLSMSHRS